MIEFCIATTLLFAFISTSAQDVIFKNDRIIKCRVTHAQFLQALAEHHGRALNMQAPWDTHSDSIVAYNFDCKNLRRTLKLFNFATNNKYRFKITKYEIRARPARNQSYRDCETTFLRITMHNQANDSLVMQPKYFNNR